MLNPVRHIAWGWIARALLLLLAPLLWLSPKLRRGWGERLGRYRTQAPEGSPRLWLHGASAGDVKALAPLARAAQQRWPQAVVILTTRTATGEAMAHQCGCFHSVHYAPWDTPGATRRAFSYINPSILVLEYTELWPQMLWVARQRQVPVVLQNGTLSARKERSYRWMFRATGNLLGELGALLMRDEEHAARARALGAPSLRVHVTGSTKLDDLPPPPTAQERRALRQAVGWSTEDPVIVWGSIHRGEEALVLRAMARLREQVPGLKGIIAPRYPERGAHLAAAAKGSGWSVQRRTQMHEPPISPDTHEPPISPHTPQLLILDTVGDLGTWYAAATLAVVGGSFIPRGGHNLVEPAACAVPILHGPYDHQIGDAVALLRGPGVEQVATEAELIARASGWLTHALGGATVGKQVRARLEAGAGAAERNLNHLAALLPSAAGRPRWKVS